MESLPVYIPIIFCLTTLVGIFIFYKATHYATAFLVVVLVWVVLQSMLALTGFYRMSNTMPPRFILLLMPPVVFIAMLFLTRRGRQFIDSLDIKTLTFFSIIRIPVEIVLFWLFANKAVPEIMTFEGRNFDVISGISAPIVYYFLFVKKQCNRAILLIWHFVCLALLINIIVIAVLSIPGALQHFGFEQPNIAVAYFPFVLLPACLVPLVLFSHLSSIRQLLMNSISLT